MVYHISKTLKQYGITLAGYTFFLSRIDALIASDMTLDYIVNSVKMKYNIKIRQKPLFRE